MTATDLMRRAAERFADQPALLGADDHWISHAELAAWADRIAAGLFNLGARPGDPVVVALHNSPELMALEHGLLRNHLVRVALGGRAHAREIAAVARDCRAAAVVVETAALDSGGVDDFPAPVVTMRPHASAAATLPELAAHPPPRAELSEPSPDDLAMLMYSSGSTGEPKAAVVTQATWASCVDGMARQLPPLGPGDVVVQGSPMSHFGGSVGLICAAHGAATVIHERFRPEPISEAIARQGGTILPLAPTLLRRLTTHLDTDTDAATRRQVVASLRALPYGGSAIPIEDLRRAVEIFGERLFQFYGLAEALTPVTVLSGADHVRAAANAPDELAAAGRAVADTDVQIIEPKPSADAGGVGVVDGAVGEIRIRGPRVMPRYWERPDLTATALRGGWFHTGDLGFRRDGLIYLVDRAKDVIVSGGFNVYPGEVERVIAGLEGVADVAVVSVPDDQWGEGVGAVVVPHPDARLTIEDVVAACRDNLAGYKKPVRVEFADALPRNAATKIDKPALRDRFWCGYQRRVGG